LKAHGDSPPTAVPFVRLGGQHQSAALAILALNSAVVGVQLGDIHTSLAGTLEQLCLHQVALAIGGAPHGVRVADAQVGVLLDLARCPEDAVSVLVEALGQIGQAGVLRKGGGIKDRYMRWISGGHLVSIYLQSTNCFHNLLLGELLCFKEPESIIFR